jgi:hypothetical protein
MGSAKVRSKRHLTKREQHLGLLVTTGPRGGQVCGTLAYKPL